MRLSYVMWQEGVSPFIAVELLSPGTENEDLGRTSTQLLTPSDRPPSKWQVYEQILRVPYYIVFDRYTDKLQVFHLSSGHYEAMELLDNRLWIPELSIGLGVWQGQYQGIERLWLRWFDAENQWIATADEQVVAAEKALQQERQRSERLAQRLSDLGIDPDEI